MSAPGPDATAELVKLARLLERQLARRRTITRKLAALDAEITTTRRFLRDLTRPFAPGEVGELPVSEPAPGEHLGGDGVWRTSPASEPAP